MYRCVNNFQIFLLLYHFGVDTKAFSHFYIFIIHFFSDNGDVFFIARPFYIFYIMYFFYFFHYIFIMRGNKLSSIIPIGFISIIFLWVMGSSTYNTTLTT